MEDEVACANPLRYDRHLLEYEHEIDWFHIQANVLTHSCAIDMVHRVNQDHSYHDRSRIAFFQ